MKVSVLILTIVIVVRCQDLSLGLGLRGGQRSHGLEGQGTLGLELQGQRSLGLEGKGTLGLELQGQRSLGLEGQGTLGLELQGQRALGLEFQGQGSPGLGLDGKRISNQFSVSSGGNTISKQTTVTSEKHVSFSSDGGISRHISIQTENNEVSKQYPISLESLLDNEWMAFKLTYNKTYRPEDESLRKEIFIENRYKIAKFNQEYGRGERNFVLQLNIFADMLHHEFNRQLNGFNRTYSVPRYSVETPSTFLPSANTQVPENIDWREVGAVTSVKNQGTCSGCWAFASAGALEAYNFRKTGQLVELSAQNLIDCTKGEPYGNDGCEGGFMDPSFEYVKDNPGIDTEASYPFEGRDGPCRFRPEDVGGTCTGSVAIAKGDEIGLQNAVATQGPVTAAIDASHMSFQFYADGVYFEPECGNSEEALNHAVLIVGYGTEPNGQKYWLVKNSYSQNWGIGGYFKIAKDENNHCGIATFASYPLV